MSWLEAISSGANEFRIMAVITAVKRIQCVEQLLFLVLKICFSDIHHTLRVSYCRCGVAKSITNYVVCALFNTIKLH